MSAVREAWHNVPFIGKSGERSAQFLWQILELFCRRRDLKQRSLAVVASGAESAFTERHDTRVTFQQARGYSLAFRNDLLRRIPDNETAHAHAAPTMRAATDRD